MIKDKVLHIRLSQELFAILQLKAESTKRTPSDYIRSMIVDSDVKMDKSKDINRVINAINKNGNNINQIAHNLNIAKLNNELSEVDYKNIIDKLVIIEYELKMITKGI